MSGLDALAWLIIGGVVALFLSPLFLRDHRDAFIFALCTTAALCGCFAALVWAIERVFI